MEKNNNTHDNNLHDDQDNNNILDKQFIVFKNISIVDKYNFYEYLSVMLDGGVSISESLESVLEKVSNPYFKQKINELKTYISSGDSFSKSMKKLANIFDSNEISIIEAGETTGTLVESLAKISEDLKKIYELRNKVKGALMYPMIIFIFLFLAIIVVLTYVIPAIKPLFENSEVELPYATKALIFTSDFIINNFLLIILAFSTLFVFFIGYKNTNNGSRQIDMFLLGLPLVGKVYRNYILSNIASTLGSLIGSGISVFKTLSLVGKSVNNLVYQDLFNEVIVRVGRGEKIVDSLREVDLKKIYFPADFTQMLSVGEKTATLEKISKKIYNQYEKEVSYSLANLTKWIEPIVILFAGFFVIWFAFAIFGAILKVTQTVS